MVCAHGLLPVYGRSFFFLFFLLVASFGVLFHLSLLTLDNVLLFVSLQSVKLVVKSVMPVGNCTRWSTVLSQMAISKVV